MDSISVSGVVLNANSTEAEVEVAVDAVLEQARAYEAEHGPSPYATTINYVEKLHLLIVHLSNNLRLALPVENLQGLESATPTQLRNYEKMGIGYAFRFPELDVDFHIDGLMNGVYGNRRWMSELGKKGGSARTDRKQAAARANGSKGGRPRKKMPA